MNKNEIEYEQISLTSDESERRLFNALNILINLNDIYDEENILSVSLQNEGSKHFNRAICPWKKN